MATTVIIIVVIVVIVVGAVALISALVMRGRSSSTPALPLDPPKTPRSEVAPMSGLETALSQVTDRAGRPIRDAIDAETAHVDDLRVPDDTGPLLRRALDHVTPHDDAPSDPSGDDVAN